MTTHREITADELAFVFQLASERADLRTIKADLAELADLRTRVARADTAIRGLAESQTALRQAVAQVLTAKGLARAGR
jgi:hypothetical protein